MRFIKKKEHNSGTRHTHSKFVREHKVLTHNCYAHPPQTASTCQAIVRFLFAAPSQVYIRSFQITDYYTVSTTYIPPFLLSCLSAMFFSCEGTTCFPQLCNFIVQKFQVGKAIFGLRGLPYWWAMGQFTPNGDHQCATKSQHANKIFFFFPTAQEKKKRNGRSDQGSVLSSSPLQSSCCVLDANEAESLSCKHASLRSPGVCPVQTAHQEPSTPGANSRGLQACSVAPHRVHPVRRERSIPKFQEQQLARPSSGMIRRPSGTFRTSVQSFTGRHVVQ